MLTATFRVDASLRIGTGHVMRCVVLANALAQAGGSSHFLMRNEPGHLADWVTHNGHTVTLLPTSDEPIEAQAIMDALRSDAPADWLVVDHYGLDETWERQAAEIARRILVVDDLANRHHRCDVLLDQNAGRTDGDYAALVAPGTRCLMGPRYALMAPAFAQSRKAALARRDRNDPPARLLISMGGIDALNLTERVLTALNADGEKVHDTIDVVLGRHAPHIDQVRARIASMRTPARLHVDTPSMAQLLCEADLAIGAGGVSALERCVLGLPTIVVAVADNQVPGSLALAEAGAVCYIGAADGMEKPLIDAWRHLQAADARQAMSRCASQVCDGNGASRVVGEMASHA